MDIFAPKYILTDIIGTTTEFTFQETLSKYIIDNVSPFLKDKLTSDDIAASLKLIKEGEEELNVESAAELIIKLTKEKSTNEGLKTLQGLIYKSGYVGGNLKGHVFPDVSKCLEKWSKDHKVAVYSTGSVEAQKLLFSHSTEGDLSAHILNYFDQSIGLKIEASSYVKIAEKLEVKPEEILFVSDDVKELKAASDAGLLKLLVKREGNEEIADDVAKDFTVVTSFEDIKLEKSNKRKNEDEIVAEEPPAKILKSEESTTTVTAKPSDAKPEIDEKEKTKTENPVTEAMEVDTTTSEVVPKEPTDEVPKVAETASVATEAMETDEAETVTSTEEIKPVEEKTEVKDAEKITEPISEKTVEEIPIKTAQSIPETIIEKTAEQPTSEAKCDKKIEEAQETVKTESKTESTVEKVPESEKVTTTQTEESVKIEDELDAVKETSKETKEVKVTEKNDSIEVKEDVKANEKVETKDKVEVEEEKVTPVEEVKSAETAETVKVAEEIKITENGDSTDTKVAENGDSKDTKVAENGDSTDTKVAENGDAAVTETADIEIAEEAKEVAKETVPEVAVTPVSLPEVEVAKEATEETPVKTVTENKEAEKSNGTDETVVKKVEDLPEVNGKHENGKCEEVPEVTSTNGDSVGKEEKSGVEDIKVKKLEASEGSPAVAVEV